jgi:antitoxin (DNA-binding transcriptional repressor) of toxin-antitoxin stability system
MSTVRMDENEVAADFAGVLEKIRNGDEVIVERNHQPIAVIQAPKRSGRLLSECIALAKARGSTATLDEGFAKDVEDGIRERSKPWNPPSWE